MRIFLVLALLVGTAHAQPAVGISKTAPLTGNGNVASPLRIAPCSLNELLKWNGSAWACAADATGSGVTDGDKGDITASSSGAVWTIDNDVVTYAKLQNVATNNRILGRVSGGGGDVEELTGAQVVTITGAITGTGTAGVLPKYTGSGATLGDSRVTDTGTGITINGYVAPTSYVTAGNSVDAFSGAVQLNNGDIAFGNATNAAVTGCINCFGYLAGVTQFRNLDIRDGKNALVVQITGNTKAVSFSGPITFNAANNVGNELTLSGTFVSNGTQTTFGNADSDYVDSRATLAVSGTNVSTASANCTVSGEAQSFTFSRSSGGSASCVIDLNRTFNSAPYCVVTNSSNKVATVYVSSSTTQVTITSSDSIDANVWCPDRRLSLIHI